MNRKLLVMLVGVMLTGCGKSAPCLQYLKGYKGIYGDGKALELDSHDDYRQGSVVVMWANKGFSVAFEHKRERNGMGAPVGTTICNPRFLVFDVVKFGQNCLPEHCAAAVLDEIPGLVDFIGGGLSPQ